MSRPCAKCSNSKRAAPLDFPQADNTQAHPRQSPGDSQNRSQQSHVGGPGPSSYDEPPSKRQRLSSDVATRTAYEQDQRFAQRPYAQPRESYGQSYLRDQASALRISYNTQGPQSVATPSAADSAFAHQRTNSSSTTSPFVSPRTEYPNYPFLTANQSYQQPIRDQHYQYQQGHYAVAQPRPPLQLDQPPYRSNVPSSLPPQFDQSRQYPRAYVSEDHGLGDRGYNPIYSTARSDYANSQYYDRPSQPPPRTLPPPAQPLSSILPPLPSSTLPSSQPLREPLQSHSSSGGSSIDGNTHSQPGGQPGQDPRSFQGYGQSSSQPSYQASYQPPYQGREQGR